MRAPCSQHRRNCPDDHRDGAAEAHQTPLLRADATAVADALVVALNLQTLLQLLEVVVVVVAPSSK